MFKLLVGHFGCCPKKQLDLFPIPSVSPALQVQLCGLQISVVLFYFPALHKGYFSYQCGLRSCMYD